MFLLIFDVPLVGHHSKQVIYSLMFACGWNIYIISTLIFNGEFCIKLPYRSFNHRPGIRLFIIITNKIYLVKAHVVIKKSTLQQAEMKHGFGLQNPELQNKIAEAEKGIKRG